MGWNLRLGHTAIYARDKKRLQTFYQNAFDMKLLPDDARGEVSRLAFDPESGLCDLSVVGHPNDVQTTFYADTLEELAVLRGKLAAAGVPVAELMPGRRIVSFYFRDPEGNRIEIAWLNEER